MTTNGSNYDVLANPTHGPRWLHFDIAPITGDSIQLSMTRVPGTWMMLGELEFQGADVQAVPEPGLMALLGLGFGSLMVYTFRASRTR